MDKILEKIVETDRASREKVKAKKQRLETINDEISIECSQFDSELKKSADESIEQTKKELEETLKSGISRIDDYFASTEKALNNSYEESHRIWSDEIFKSITE